MKDLRNISTEIGYIRSRLIRHLIGETGKLTILAVAVFFFVMLPLRYGAQVPDTWFFALCTVFLAGYVAVLWYDVFAPASRVATRERTARFIEHRYPQLHGALISAYQFESNPQDQTRFGLSQKLMDAHIEQVKQQLAARSIADNPASTPHRRLGRYWVYIVALLVIPTLFFTDFYARSMYQAYADYFDPPTPFKDILVVRPGSTTVVFGASLTVRAISFTQAAGTPFITFCTPHTDQMRRAMIKDDRYSYSYTFTDIQEPITYTVDHGNLTSDTYTVESVTLPIIVSHSIHYKYPSYTGYEPVEQDRRQFDDISALRNTQITLTVNSNNPLRSAHLHLARDNRVIPFTITDETTAKLTFALVEDDRYTVLIVDQFGQENEPVAHYKLIAVADNAPAVRILNPAADIEMPRSMKVDLSYEASDDILLQSAELVYTVSGEERTPYVLNAAINADSYDQTYTWELTKLRLSPGDDISYYIQVFDWYPPPEGPHSARSAVHTIRFPSLVEMYKRRQQVFDEPAGELAKAKDTQTALLERFEKLSEKIAESKSVSWSDKQSLAGIMDTQQQISQMVQQQAQSLEENLEQLQVATDVLEKYEQIKAIMDNLLTEQMKETLRKLNETIEQSDDYKQLLAELEQSRANLEEFSENLERTLELLKKLSVQNSLKQMIDAADAALDQNETLFDQLDQWAKDPQAQADMESIKDSLRQSQQLTDYIDQSMKSLNNRQLSDESITQAIRELQQMWNDKQVATAIEAMKQQVAQNNPSAARQSGSRSQQSMADFKKALEQLLNRMQTGKKLIADISDMIRRLLRVAGELESLIASMQRYQGKNMAKNTEHATTMFFIQNELHRMAHAIEEMSSESPVIDPRFAKPLTDMAGDLSNNTETVFKKGDMNVVAVLNTHTAKLRYEASTWVALLESLMRAQQSGGGDGQMPADLDDFFKQLDQLAQQQAQLNQQTGMLPQPGQSPSAMQQYLNQLAAEQKLLSEALSKLSQGLSGRQRVLGDLNNISAQMDKASRQLGQGDVDADLKQRQQQILTRLLEAEKSLTTRDKSKERESKTAQDTEPARTPDDIDQSLLDRNRESLLRTGGTGYIPGEYRDLVKEYFKLLMKQR